MELGVIFPQIEFPPSPDAVQAYAQAVEEMGYSYVLAYDHVLGANPERPGGWRGPYTWQDPFLEPFLLFSYMAAATSTIGFATGILILPQRESALVAKQAATLDVLCGGRLRLGVGLGWNEVEYEALGQDFSVRGQRIEEQVTLLRLLWTEPLVTFDGRWHQISDAGLNPLPVQRPIPLWFGGYADAALARMARLGDGWITTIRTPEKAQPKLDTLQHHLEDAGRSMDGFGLEAFLDTRTGGPDEWAARAQAWLAAGATHLAVNTMGAGHDSVDDHLAALARFAEQL